MKRDRRTTGVGKGNGRHQQGPEHHRYTGPAPINPRGYATVNVGTDHPMANRAGLVLLHQLIWATAHPDELQSDDIVHHVNGNKLDNRLCNLERMSLAEHMAHHSAAMLAKRNGGSNPELDGVVYDARPS